MRTGLFAATFTAVALVAGLTAAQTAPAPVASPLLKVEGYLGKDRIPNAILILPPPPADGSLSEQDDFAKFMAMRKLEGTPRWAMAARDALDYFGAFTCPLGLPLTAETTPKTFALLRRLGVDAGAITNLAKDHFARHRPLWGNMQPICVESQREGLLKSASYPSGHTTFGWAAGLVLAELVPGRASDILARARAFGESRAVCGVHFATDVEEGRTNGAALVAVLHSDPTFQVDLAEAKAELKAALAAPHAAPDAGQCKVETDAEIHTPWVNPTADK